MYAFKKYIVYLKCVLSLLLLRSYIALQCSGAMHIFLYSRLYNKNNVGKTIVTLFHPVFISLELFDSSYYTKLQIIFGAQCLNSFNWSCSSPYHAM